MLLRKYCTILLFLFLRVLKVLLRGAKKICIPPWRRKPYVVKPPLERKNDTPPDPEFLTAPPAKICLPTYDAGCASI